MFDATHLKNQFFQGSFPAPVLEVKPLCYPYILDDACYDGGQTDEQKFKKLLHEYCRIYWQRLVEKPDAEKLLQAYGTDWNRHDWDGGIFGKATLDQVSKHTVNDFPFTFDVGLTRARWEVRRFGHCLGIRVTHKPSGELHEESLAIFEQMIREHSSAWLDFYPAAYQMKVVTVPTIEELGTEMQFCITHEIDELRGFVPKVQWTHPAAFFADLFGNFLNCSDDGVVVGAYLDFPVHARLLLESREFNLN